MDLFNSVVDGSMAYMSWSQAVGATAPSTIGLGSSSGQLSMEVFSEYGLFVVFVRLSFQFLPYDIQGQPRIASVANRNPAGGHGHGGGNGLRLMIA